ncbi:MAG: Polysaccharide deacetylase [Lentisphaerae bacterium ADurb.Bin242]|nr:MAG: Polysaccharide deacetylase [Lentisphaerae bacterium ADurb.Bin242]
MEKMFFGMSVDDVALRHWSTVENFRRLVKFLSEEKAPAAFFVVPVDEETDKPFNEAFPEYVPAIREAHAKGFCFAQHGLRHNRFEFGIPPDMILDLPHEAENKRYAAENRAKLAAEHTPANLVPRLRQGREILEKALGFAIEGFRAPALQESPGMFEALALEDYKFDSSACLQETGWDYLLGRAEVPPREITRERWLALRKKSAVPILPLTCDYTWYLSEENFNRMFELAKHDYLACREASVPFVTVCHVDPVWNGCGIRLLSSLFAFARRDALEKGYELVFETLDKIVRQKE